jgi:hypothetical protein
MHLHDVKLWKRDRGLLGSTDLQDDGTAESSGMGLSLMITLSVNSSFPSAWDAVGYTYFLVGYQIDDDVITKHAHPRLFYFDEENRSAPRRVRLSATERP